MPTNFNPTEYQARQDAHKKAKHDFEAHKLANPSPNSIAKLLERLRLFEAAKL